VTAENVVGLVVAVALLGYLVLALIFPESGQDIQYAEDLPSLPDVDIVLAALSRIWLLAAPIGPRA